MPANKSKKSAPTAVASEPVERIPFFDAVREAKEIGARFKAAERDKLRLGELAHKVVHPTYGNRTFAKFAKASGHEESTLGHYRTVYRKWEGKLPPGAKFSSFSVLKELASVDERAALIAAEPDMSKRRAEVHRVLKDHPKREEIRRKYPDLTCTRQARDIMHSYDSGGAKGAGNGKGGTDFKRWFKKLIDRCEEDIDEAAVVDQRVDVAQLRNLLGGIEPDLLETVKEAGEAWLTLYNFLMKLCEEGPQAVAEELERRAKENAARGDLPKRRAKKAPTAQAEARAQVTA